jgi:hypothetical protein
MSNRELRRVTGAPWGASVDEQVEYHRIARGECPAHGRELVLVPADNLVTRAQKKCPDVGCDYMTTAREI